MENNRLRIVMAALLLAVVFFYNADGVAPEVPKLEKPQEDIVKMVEELAAIDNEEDSSKVAGMFNAVSEKLKDSKIESNLQLQYLLDFVGKDVFGSELVGKYPLFSPSAAKLIEKVIGKQDEEAPMTSEEKKKLARLFYGFSWKLYKKDQENLFDEYKSKALSSIAKYNKEDEKPEPKPDVEECPCKGKGYIVHGDGHVTDCPCIQSGEDCDHDPKCKQAELPPVDTATSVLGKLGLSSIPNIQNYRPVVGIRGMTIKWHLENGAAGEHEALPSGFVDTLTTNQKYWLHDYLHGYKRNTPIKTKSRGILRWTT